MGGGEDQAEAQVGPSGLAQADQGRAAACRLRAGAAVAPVGGEDCARRMGDDLPDGRGLAL